MNRRLLIYGSVTVLLLLGVAAYLFLRLYNILPGNGESERSVELDTSLYEAVPSDAILVCDISEPQRALNWLVDTSLFGGIFSGRGNALLTMQRKMLSSPLFAERNMLYSLHYSSKKKISFLQIVDASDPQVERAFKDVAAQGEVSARDYNGTSIYTAPDGLAFALCRGRAMLSNSAYVLESSIRHLANGSSILDNKEFREVMQLPGAKNRLILRNSQTGKIFSSVVAPKSVKYADYSQKFATWTLADITVGDSSLLLEESFVNNQDADCLDYVYSRLEGGESRMTEVLPANTVAAISYTVGDVADYMRVYEKFLEANRRLTRHVDMGKELSSAQDMTPLMWADTLQIEEALCALCESGGAYEWITAIKCGASGRGFISSLFSKEQDTTTREFKYKGFAAHLFGRLFANTTEDYYLERDGWRIIGRRGFISSLVSPKYKYLSLGEYLEQTPAAGIFKGKAAARLYLNMLSYRDSLAKNYIPFIAEESVSKLFERKNFIIFTASAGKGKRAVSAKTELFCALLPELTMERKIELPEGKSGEHAVLPVHEGPFVLKDFANGGNCTLEQLPDNSLRYTTSLGKAAWTISFPGKVAGCVEQADLYRNRKLQMILAHKNLLYAIDRLGRYVKGYPVTLPSDVAYGPAVYSANGGKDLYVSYINAENAVVALKIDGTPIPGWRDIELEEFISSLPMLEKRGDALVWVLETYKDKYEFALDGSRMEGNVK